MMKIFLSVLLIATITPVQAKTFKLATLAPDGTVWMKEMRKSAALIKKQTSGRIKLKFYPGGIMGNEKSVLRKIRLGQLHGGAFTTSGLAKISPKNQIYSLPFKYFNYAEVDFIRSKMDHIITDGIEKKGFVTFGLAEGGFAYLFSQEPVKTYSELKGKKIWIPEGDAISRTMMSVTGMSSTALPLTDVLTGLQTGLIDTFGATPSFAIALQWHSKVKYLTPYPAFYSIGAFVISKKSFKKIKPADQKIVHKELSAVLKKLNKLNRLDNENALAALKKYGIKFVKDGPGARKELDEVSAKTANALLKKGAYTPAVLKKLDKHLTQFRKKSGKHL